MINTDWAHSFIAKFRKNLDNNINIMDENGIIIASSDKRREGTFHEIAYDIVTKKREIVEATSADEYIGVQPGVNMALVHDGATVGVVGITGDPDEVRPSAMILKMAVEAMLETEIVKEQAKLANHMTLREHFHHCLLYERDMPAAELKSISEQLGIVDNLMRVPLLCTFEDKADPARLLSMLTGAGLVQCCDIAMGTKDRCVVICKSFDIPDECFLTGYRRELEDYVSNLEGFFARNDLSCHIYCGSVHKSLAGLQTGCQHCAWLRQNLAPRKQSVYFYDHMDAYLRAMIPLPEMHKILNVFGSHIDDEFCQILIKAVDALEQNCYSLSQASRQLYVHKNTLVFWLGKIKSTLDMDPLHSEADRKFLSHLCFYLKRCNG